MTVLANGLCRTVHQDIEVCWMTLELEIAQRGLLIGSWMQTDPLALRLDA